jgi:NhaP-type Na+/H+ or K+/H+ antiporter
LTFAIVARYSRWLRMPSTRRYWRRGWQLFASWGNFRKLPGLFPAGGVLPAARSGVHPPPRRQ